MKLKWLNKDSTEGKTVEVKLVKPKRYPDEELRAKIEAKMSARRIREVSEEFYADRESIEGNTFTATPVSDELVFVADGSNIEVEEMTVDFNHVDFGKEVDEVETAWGNIEVGREEANFKKENR